MLKYWVNVLAMLGVAILATALFHKDAQAVLVGICAGVTVLIGGAILSALEVLSERRPK